MKNSVSKSQPRCHRPPTTAPAPSGLTWLALPLLGLSLFVGASLSCPAPAAANPPTIDQPAAGLPAQHFVLLRNGNVLTGTVTQIGDSISVANLDRSQINLGSDQVETIANSIGELYQYRKSHRFDGDLNRLHADVRWCLRNGLLREAAADVLSARSLDPTDPVTIQLLRLIANRIKQETPIPASIEPNNGGLHLPADTMIRTVSHETTAATPDNTGPNNSANTDPISRAAGISQNSINEFATRIQPILMNRCASCHARDDGNDRTFQIHSARTARWAGKQGAVENLEAVLQYVDLQAPLNSMIRTKATDGHGGRRGGFGSEGSAMMNNLDQWLSQIRLANPLENWQQTLEENQPTETPLTLADPPELSPVAATAATNTANEIPAPPAPIAPTPASWSTPLNESPRTVPRMRRMPKVENPFDPEIFNRRVHGK